ncbi:SDR family oxidoreductase [Poritiphilus flavus]|uniref:NAD(P)H-binding protein n=1 Tax=Poritiphilus flavus TaxID=2697053 RepID=A0A6L9E7Y2_9FLAO|nr:SDR family oxidoreductase [Poritiphilus flavus]NAS10718.1 NAD(P)H-binding protein [Poritiphilus flavus]
MSEAIGILGCGWLGFPLAKTLVQKGYTVKGSTTSPAKTAQLKESGIIPYIIKLEEDSIEGNPEFFEGLKTIVINVPPGLRGGSSSNYVSKIIQLAKALRTSGVSQLIFVSSTSVYGDLHGEVTEDSVPRPVTASGKQLLETEGILMEDAHFKTTVVRFGGLIGPNRHPASMLSGKMDLKNGEDPVNLIHLDDAIHMIVTILEEGYWNDLFNGVYPDHPAKRDYYTSEALKRGLEPPKYVEKSGKIPGKSVKSRNFLNKKGSFLTPIRS